MKRPIHRFLVLLLPFALLFSFSAQAVVTDEPYEDIPGVYHIMDVDETPSALLAKSRVYEGQFADVDPAQWFYAYVAASYEYGLFAGRDNGFAPDAPVKLNELLTLSARIRAAYEGETIRNAAAGESWDTPYIEYLLGKGLLDLTLTDYNAPATRAQLAGIFAVSLPEGAFDNLNAALVTDAYASGDYISDVNEYTPYQPQILWLYRQGLLAGVDNTGSFRPDTTTTRAETAAVVTRMVDPSLRITLGWAVRPAYSAVGTTLASLVTASGGGSRAPSYSDTVSIDAIVSRMLAANEHEIELNYGRWLTRSDAAALANAFTARVKSYCEQMYNSVLCQTYSDGTVTLDFSATACSGEQLVQYRDATMAQAIAVHDLLWEQGYLTKDMSQYEIAQVYYSWLCDHCVYDYRGANDVYSLSHIAYNALINGKAVCDGYTGAYNLFLKLEGIECYALPNDTHIWTVATLDGTEYHIDTTWGDQYGRVDMSFFGMSAEQAYQAHPW